MMDSGDLTGATEVPPVVTETTGDFALRYDVAQKRLQIDSLGNADAHDAGHRHRCAHSPGRCGVQSGRCSSRLFTRDQPS
jgi:hypothetical protein